MIIRTLVLIQPSAMALADLFGFPSFLEWGEDLASRSFNAINSVLDAAEEKSGRVFINDLEAAATRILTREEGEVVTINARFITATQLEIHVDAKETTQGFNSEENGWIIH